jgi:chain length determinant protein tyrosine kinase EpsG
MMNSVTEMLPTVDASESDFSRVGEALNLKQTDIERIVARQEERKVLFGQAAKELGLVTEADLQKVLSEQFGYSYVHDNNNTLSKELIAAHQPFSQAVENIRSLRGQLLIRWFNGQHKTLVATSSNTEDGASVLLANLAIVFSQLNKKTLLIDANLRQPNQHKLFGVETKLGLANILANRQGRYELTPQKSLPNLTILTAGTEAPNPQELLNRDGLVELLSDLEKMYDIILIDTSPSNLGMDYLTVVAKVKAALIVVRKDSTRIDDLAQIKSQIEIANAQIVGSVVQEF